MTSMERRSDALVDVMRVPVDGDPGVAIIPVGDLHAECNITCDVLVVGGGTGGVAAALAAARRGKRVHLIEETDWIGGQLTAQGISALDEHDHIESFGGTASYYDLRNALRDHYRPLAGDAGGHPHFNPGNCWVTRVAFEPKVAVAAIYALLQPHIEAGRITLHLRTKVAAAETSGNRIVSVAAIHLENSTAVRFRPGIVLDATELGDVLPLVGAEYSLGAETIAETGEVHAQPSEPKPHCVQSFTYVFGLERRAGWANGMSSGSRRVTTSSALRNPTACGSRCTAGRSTVKKAVGWTTRCSHKCRAPRAAFGPIAA